MLYLKNLCPKCYNCALASQGYCGALPQTWWLETREISFLTVLEAQILKSVLLGQNPDICRTILRPEVPRENSSLNFYILSWLLEFLGLWAHHSSLPLSILLFSLFLCLFPLPPSLLPFLCVCVKFPPASFL